jgi:glycolate oxidase FAD binding subunit
METSPTAQAVEISKALEERLRSLVGVEYVQNAGPHDGVAGLQAQLIVSPGTEEELAAVLRCADESGLSVLPRGGGTKLEWGNPPKRADLILSTARLSKILDYAWADLTVSVQAGCTLQALQETLAQIGQRLAFDALWPERATVGGVLSTNDSGALRLRFGALRDLIIGVTLALPDGTLASSGGRVVKNVAGYDLPKLATGAFGTLGVITRAVFRLHPMCLTSLTLSFSTASIDEMQQKILAIQDSKLAHTALQIRFEKGASCVADILLEATEAGLSAQREQLEKIVGPLNEGSSEVWRARQDLWAGRTENSAILKVSILPATLAKTTALVEKFVGNSSETWRVVFQATGIGWLRLDGQSNNLLRIVKALRAEFENDGGSLFIADCPNELRTEDAWGSAGDALVVMRALKHRLDPRNTLNPGRFVGGI